MNKTTRAKARAEQKRNAKQLQKDITEANKDFLKQFFKTLNNGI